MIAYTSVMKISVVIPAFNEERYIGGCLEALLRQSRLPDEIIVVDNNSTDTTAVIVQRYSSVSLIHEERQGMTPARNRGFSKCTGDIIVRTDADCLPPPHWIKSIETHFMKPDVDALSGPLRYYDLPGDQQGVLLCNTLAFMLNKYNGTVLMTGPNYALRKNLWEKLKDEACVDDRHVHEDIDLAMRIHKTGARVVWDKELVMETSGRRISKKPLSFFGEYPIRFAKTCVINSELSRNLKRTAEHVKKPIRRMAAKRALKRRKK